MPHSKIQMLALPASVVSYIEESPRCRLLESKFATDLKELRKIEFELGRSLAQRALTQAGWRADDNGHVSGPAVAKNLDRSPNWPAGFVGSISHSDRWIWVAVSRADELVSIGIDTEGIVEPMRATELRSAIGRDLEWERIARIGFSGNIAFTLLFSAKEAFFKLGFPLLGEFWEFQDLEATDVRLDSPTGGQTAGSAGEIHLRCRDQVLKPESRSEPKSNFNPFATAHPVRFQIIGKDVFTFAWVRRSEVAKAKDQSSGRD